MSKLKNLLKMQIQTFLYKNKLFLIKKLKITTKTTISKTKLHHYTQFFSAAKHLLHNIFYSNILFYSVSNGSIENCNGNR